MAKRSHPRRGSMAFSPRKRSARHFGHVKSWPETDASEVRVQGFAGWKAGMTHIMARDLNPRSNSAGQEIRIPVTVVEVPKMRVLGVRGYKMTPYGKQAAGEAWVDAEQITEAFPQLFRRMHNNAMKVHDSEKHLDALGEADLVEVRIIAATQPHSITGTPSKTPEVMELGLVGGDTAAKLEWAKENLLGDELIGALIVEKSLSAPLKKIASNAGQNGAVIFERVKEADFEVGYNAATNELVNMFDIGIIDPAKVTRSTLQNAASIASMVLTTECIIVDKTTEENSL